MTTPPQDKSERDRFVTELEKNFSVVAAAGAGKTSAITERIVEIAKDRHRACEWFPRLVVVTFTNRAADEMQQRARQRIFQEGVAPEVLAAFNRAFFGTIHSFCMKLLAAHGHHLGLPARLELITDDDKLWNDFVQQTHSVGHSLSPENRDALLRHVQLRDLMELGRRGKLRCRSSNARFRARRLSILRHFEIIRQEPAQGGSRHCKNFWPIGKNDFTAARNFCRFSNAPRGGRFEEMWEETFRELYDWLSCCALTVAAEVQAKYRQFRAERGVVTFDDQIALTLELARTREAISRIRGKDYIVILDEAQDTDPQQFDILLEITRPTDATGVWMQDRQSPPRPGHFCMVGDFQQSIYRDRADLKQYRRIHQALVTRDAGEELKFSVTFRLDAEQLEFVKKCFRDILNGAGGQVDFVELNPRPNVLPGQVIRLDLAAEGVDAKASDPQKARIEAAQLARWISQVQCDKLRARSWEQVAILCPRKKWFAPIADALRKIDIDSQIQSETDVKGDSPAHAWFTALLVIMTQPRCSFEIAGVLREVFGVSDHDLAMFSDGKGDRFQIETPTGGSDAVSKIVDLLARVHAEIAQEPLFSAVRRIVDATFLRERLRTLPAEDFEALDVELDVLLESAATAEANGETLEEFADLLQANFATERDTSAPRAGAIQLITCQKAKGLEWDAVIVPFFARRIHTADEDFPRMIGAPHDPEAVVAFSKGNVPAEKKDALKRADAQEMERLLYVALTRARHTLVLATDLELFAKADGKAPSTSLTKWLRSDSGESNAQHVAKLRTEPADCGQTRAHQLVKAATKTEGEKPAALPEVSLPAARKRAAEFSRRLIPSSFTPAAPAIARTAADKWKETENEFRATTVPSAATRYGIWWHEFIQRIPWQSDPSAWDKVFESACANSPDHARSVREWQRLREQVSKLPDFAPEFSDAALIVHAEMPFFWATDERRCLEGIVDLALAQPVANKWLILDWKTNDITADKIDTLRAHYRPQLAAYWKAVREMAGAEVAAAIYSTAVGALIRYDADELAEEWARLEKLPVNQFDIEMAVAISSDAATARVVQMEFAALN